MAQALLKKDWHIALGEKAARNLGIMESARVDMRHVRQIMFGKGLADERGKPKEDEIQKGTLP